MRREGNTVIYTDQELKGMIERGEDRTDWERLRVMTDEEVEANADADEDFDGEWIPVKDAMALAFPNKVRQLDADVVEWFAAKGPDYVRRMNDVLRDYITSQEKMSSAAD